MFVWSRRLIERDVWFLRSGEKCTRRHGWFVGKDDWLISGWIRSNVWLIREDQVFIRGNSWFTGRNSRFNRRRMGRDDRFQRSSSCRDRRSFLPRA